MLTAIQTRIPIKTVSKIEALHPTIVKIMRNMPSQITSLMQMNRSKWMTMWTLIAVVLTASINNNFSQT